MNDTMRANILLGRTFDEEYYWKVIHACALTQDIESWPDGDLTMIGERGINISGGQRARLALARTVYSRADVYILDDPLSAVDAHVKRHILDNVILSSGLLGNSLRVVTTHAESMLPFCNQIVTVSDRTMSVVHQEPKEHVVATTISASDNSATCDATPDKAKADSTHDDPADDNSIKTDIEKPTPAADATADPEPAKEKKQPKKWTLWENAKYVFNICGWHVFTTLVITASFRPVSDFILDGYNIAALKENAKSDTVSHDAVLWYLKVRLFKAATSVALDKIEEFIAEGPYIVEDCRVPSQWPPSGNVEFKDLSVKYGADLDYALKNLNVVIRPGEKIGIVGRTGAGKSTLAKTIFRLLNEDVEGSVEIDGHNIAKFGVGDFRPKLGIIPQESTMFNGTVKRNLDPLNEFTIEDMWAAMIKCGVADVIEPKRKRKSAGIADDDEDIDGEEDNDEVKIKADEERWEKAGFLMRALLFLLLKKKYKKANDKHQKIGINRNVGQDDNRFSSGQRQLFSLCRLIMRKRKVLILDEATAEVDLETDGKMQELIRSEFSECTVLTIAHRLDTIMSSDRIIVMEKGEIAEIGPPQELIAKGGKFAELVKANEF
ncbi:ABC transporter C member 13 [Coemansia spiralis]|uniref:ABC transporter C member 13 n=1 Tax=Coemansia spiralis TaxID=417178 RepID=A0A9W8GP35_9FUNG|nr:ABC transporter C member 13 [Coemansia spiralis]